MSATSTITPTARTFRLPVAAVRPGWRTASVTGSRSVNADAAATTVDPATGRAVAALADGVGDDARAARAARIAASAAARTPASEGAVEALLAAQRAVRADELAGDCVLVVAVPLADGGHDIAWVGDVRAWAHESGGLRQLTTDHTLAEYFRARGTEVSPRMEHLVTTSVRTAREHEIGTVRAPAGAGLVLTTDGVHKVLAAATMSDLLAWPEPAANLVRTAETLGGTDNATALVVGPAAAAECETVALPAAA